MRIDSIDFNVGDSNCMRIDQGHVDETTLMYANRLVCETTDIPLRYLGILGVALLLNLSECLGQVSVEVWQWSIS